MKYSELSLFIYDLRQFYLFIFICSSQEFVDSFSRALAYEYSSQGVVVQV